MCSYASYTIKEIRFKFKMAFNMKKMTLIKADVLLILHMFLQVDIVLSQQVTLDVFGSTSNSVLAGSNVLLACTPETFISSTDRLEIQFKNNSVIVYQNGGFTRPDGQIIVPGAHYTGTRSNSEVGNGAFVIILTVAEVTQMDAGQYQCLITTSSQTYKSRLVSIEVLELPKTECSADELPEATFKDGELTTSLEVTSTLTCVVESNQEHLPVILKWTRSDGKPMEQSGYLVEAKVSLLTSIEDDDVLFTCTASNSKYDNSEQACSIRVTVDEGFVNVNYTAESSGPGSSVALISAVSVTVIILLIVLIIAASYCLLRTARTQKDEENNNILMSTPRSQPTIVHSSFHDRDNVHSDNIESHSYSESIGHTTTADPRRSIPKYENNADLIKQLNQNFGEAEPSGSTDSANQSYNINGDTEKPFPTNVGTTVYSEVPIGLKPSKQALPSPVNFRSPVSTTNASRPGGIQVFPLKPPAKLKSPEADTEITWSGTDDEEVDDGKKPSYATVDRKKKRKPPVAAKPKPPILPKPNNKGPNAFKRNGHPNTQLFANESHV